MECLTTIERFFNNQSVGAFFGAFAAFALVMLNDARRDRKKVRNLRAEVEMNLAHAENRGQTPFFPGTRCAIKPRSTGWLHVMPQEKAAHEGQDHSNHHRR